MLSGLHARGGTVHDDDIYVAMNAHWEGHTFELPRLPSSRRWHVFANTGAAPPEDVWDPGDEVVLGDQQSIYLGPHSVLILVGK
jgi:glycogen operon protein